MSNAENVLSVGLRSDGQVVITSCPNVAGPAQAQSFIMPVDTARWLARQIFSVVNQRPPADGEKP